MRSFAKSICEITQIINSEDLSNRESSVLKSAISDLLKKVGDLHPSGASVAALERFQTITDEIDLRDLVWQRQHRYDPGREIFHREHSETISSLRDMCIDANNPEAIFSILMNKVRIVWILKEEDRRLTANGDLAQRRDWRESYRNAGIVVVEPIEGWPEY